ncbi:hypothetical protein D1007_05609 [Hordeum vulgare]|nr:hypothetical protein D1007_05609 [Hordeum vulgare]
MTASGSNLWDNLSSKMRHEVDAIVAALRSCHAQWIEQGMPPSSPEARAHYDATMAEVEQHVPASMSALGAHEDQWYHMFLL